MASNLGMSNKADVESVIGLIHGLMLSAKSCDPQPWLQLELTREQMRILFLLFTKGKFSPGEVAESFGVPKANVTSVLDRLVSKGLVSRQENPNDRRSYILSITEEGKGQIDRLLEIGNTEFKKVLEIMTADGLASLKQGLEALNIAFKEYQESKDSRF
jgi:DNA-binding MarR family transcriptional regulator